MGIISGPGSFAVQFGDHLRSWDHLRTRTAAIIDPESTAAEMKDIRLGRFNLLFGSPEALLNSHRTVIRDLKDSNKAVFVDESHCIAKW